MKARASAILALFLSLPIVAVAAEAPVAVAAPRKARARIVEEALSCAGAPYAYGGSDQGGFDCSGLVYRVFLRSIGAALPRTARELHEFCEPIDPSRLQPGDLIFFDTAGAFSHVGIYEGEGRFVHAASEGPKTGVIVSSLAESYWSRTRSAAGRVVPPAEYLGLALSASLGPSLGAVDFLRGARGSFGVAYRLLGVEAGLELRPEYDATLGVARLPAVLALGIDGCLKAFAGPALTIGSPRLDGSRRYSAGGGILATAGLDYTIFRFRVAGFDAGIFGELVYNRYVPGADPDPGKDAAARVRAGLGLELRWGV